MGMEFLYFPEDKSEYLPGILSILVIILVSGVIFRLLARASKREVDKLEQQGFHANAEYKPGYPAEQPQTPKKEHAPEGKKPSEPPPPKS